MKFSQSYGVTSQRNPVFGSLSLRLPNDNLIYIDSDSDSEWERAEYTNKFSPEPDHAVNSSTMLTSNSIKFPHSLETARKDSLLSLEKRSRICFNSVKGLGNFATHGLCVACQSNTSDIVVKLLWLSVFHAANPKRARQFEYTSILAPAATRICSHAAKISLRTNIYKPLSTMLGLLVSFQFPATLSIGYRLCRMLWHQTRSKRTPDSGGLRVTRTQEIGQSSEHAFYVRPSLETLRQAVLEKKPETALAYVAIYKDILNDFKMTLDWHKIESCKRFSARFDKSDAELMRYAIACNILKATTSQELEEVFDAMSDRLEESLAWHKCNTFMNLRTVRAEWGHLVAWTRRLDSGHPVLLLRLGQAIEESRGERAELYGQAIIAQVDRGTRHLLKKDCVDQIVAIIDCEGACSYNVNKIFGLLRTVPLTLNKHYPHRLKVVYITNVPVVLHWVINIIKAFMHEATRSKFMVIGSDTDSLPLDVRQILKWDSSNLTASASENTALQVT